MDDWDQQKRMDPVLCDIDMQGRKQSDLVELSSEESLNKDTRRLEAEWLPGLEGSTVSSKVKEGACI